MSTVYYAKVMFLTSKDADDYGSFSNAIEGGAGTTRYTTKDRRSRRGAVVEAMNFVYESGRCYPEGSHRYEAHVIRIVVYAKPKRADTHAGEYVETIVVYR